MLSRGVLALLLLVAALAGCVGTPAEGPLDPQTTQEDRPDGLEGPFEVRPVEVQRVEMTDGVEINMAIWRPDVSKDVQVPVVLEAEPYADACYLAPSPATCSPPLHHQSNLAGAAGIGSTLVEAGYAFAVMSVRGTGDSGGCLDLNGPQEASDIGEVIAHLADRPWSNGRVAMAGISYMGTTPWLGALQGQEALKAIVPAGIVTDEYTFGFTPQGAAQASTAGFNVPYFTSLTLAPPVTTADPAAPTDWATYAPERLCPGLADMVAAYPAGMATDTRDPGFFGPRSNLHRLDEVTAGVLVSQGFHEGSPGHGFQEDAISQALTGANLTMVLGQWGHTWPTGDLLEDHPQAKGWETMLLSFLDHHLQGQPAPPWLGTVTYQTTDGTWSSDRAWPPEASHEEVLYASTEGLTPEPGTGGLALAGTSQQDDPACTALSAIGAPTAPAHLVTTEPVGAPITLAGNPMAYLTIESQAPGGLMAVDLYDLGPEASCGPAGATDTTWLTGGAADLRFHSSPFQGKAFPVDTPTPVRIDLMNLAHTLEPGHRLGLAISTWGRSSYTSTHQGSPVEVVAGEDASHLVVPLAGGSLGGQAPTLEYPPRPFLHEPPS